MYFTTVVHSVCRVDQKWLFKPNGVARTECGSHALNLPPPALLAPSASNKSSITYLTSLQQPRAVRLGCYNPHYDSAARTRTSPQIPAPALRLSCLSTENYGFDKQEVIPQYYKQLEKTSDMWLCRYGVWRSQKKTGLLNLTQHLEQKHKNKLSSTRQYSVLKTHTFPSSLLHSQK